MWIFKGTVTMKRRKMKGRKMTTRNMRRKRRRRRRRRWWWMRMWRRIRMRMMAKNLGRLARERWSIHGLTM
jgi:hypothetical protein